MFGVLAGVRSISAVCATFAARFLPTASTFQVSNNVGFEWHADHKNADQTENADQAEQIQIMQNKCRSNLYDVY